MRMRWKGARRRRKGIVWRLWGGILSAGGAAVRRLWHSLTGKVHDREVANRDSEKALDVMGRAVLGLLDSESLKTPEDQQNLTSMEALAPEIRNILSNNKVPEDTKKTLDSWYRNAQTIVKKGRAGDAAAEIQTLLKVVTQLVKGDSKIPLDIKSIRGEWLDSSRRIRAKRVNEDELAGMAKSLISRHPLVASSSEMGMRGRVTLGDQNPSVPRPGNPPKPMPPKPD